MGGVVRRTEGKRRAESVGRKVGGDAFLKIRGLTLKFSLDFWGCLEAERFE